MVKRKTCLWSPKGFLFDQKKASPLEDIDRSCAEGQSRDILAGDRCQELNSHLLGLAKKSLGTQRSGGFSLRKGRQELLSHESSTCVSFKTCQKNTNQHQQERQIQAINKQKQTKATTKDFQQPPPEDRYSRPDRVQQRP